MYNAIRMFAVVALALAITACGSDGRSEKAAGLLGQAREAAGQKDYAKAINLLDTLDKSFRDCLDLRREGTRLRSETLRDMTIDSISASEQRLLDLNSEVERMKGDFCHVDMDGTDGYDVYAPAMKAWSLNRTGVQPRIDADGYFFIAVNLAGREVGLNGVSAGGVSTLPSESVAVEGSEIMNINQENSAPLMERLMQMEAPVTLSLNGRRGKAEVRLDAAALQAFKATWQYASARQELRLNLIRRERLERQLSRLRDVLANMPVADDTSADN